MTKAYETCVYIFFRSSFKNGEHEVKAIDISEDKNGVISPLSIDWTTGNLIILSFPLFKKVDENWNNISIQNFKRLKQEVDEALKGA
jgi:hypothetical protein